MLIDINYYVISN